MELGQFFVSNFVLIFSTALHKASKIAICEDLFGQIYNPKIPDFGSVTNILPRFVCTYVLLHVLTLKTCKNSFDDRNTFLENGAI